MWVKQTVLFLRLPPLRIVCVEVQIQLKSLKPSEHKRTEVHLKFQLEVSRVRLQSDSLWKL